MVKLSKDEEQIEMPYNIAIRFKHLRKEIIEKREKTEIKNLSILLNNLDISLNTVGELGVMLAN